MSTVLAIHASNPIASYVESWSSQVPTMNMDGSQISKEFFGVKTQLNFHSLRNKKAETQSHKKLLHLDLTQPIVS
jgi:hypothetical protein